MRVAVYHSNRDVRIEDRPVPEIGSGEVLVRIESSGICGSDVMESYRVPRAPLILGHEIAGVIAAAGDDVDDLQAGDRVFATHHVPCTRCHRCRSGHPSTCETLRSTHFDPGGFAEFCRVPALQVQRGMLPLPEDVSFDAASFIEPLGCVVQAQRYAGLATGQTVLVLGSGLSGLLHIQLARHRGAAKVLAADLHPYRLEAARRLGADAALDAREDLGGWLREANRGRLADRVLVCTGAPAALRQACRLVEPGGRLLAFAPASPGEEVPLPIFDLWRDEIGIVFSYAASGEDLVTALELIRRGAIRVEDMITHRLPLTRAAEGFRLTAEAGESLKVILRPQES
ncbi:MAG: alcohol dehydrogenase catalytic domain-containing protein [Acidobacteriota bacterium]